MQSRKFSSKGFNIISKSSRSKALISGYFFLNWCTLVKVVDKLIVSTAFSISYLIFKSMLMERKLKENKCLGQHIIHKYVIV